MLYVHSLLRLLPICFLQKQQYQIMNTMVIEINIIIAIAHAMKIESWSFSSCHPRIFKFHSKPLEISCKNEIERITLVFLP